MGALAEAAVALALTKEGYVVFVPFFSAHGRIDLIYQRPDGSVSRVQCKSARLVGDVMAFYTCSHTGGIRRDYRNEVDEFGVYCARTDSVYVIPVEDVPARQAHLRLGPTRNNQASGVRWAEPYRLAGG
ncbi:MAG: hypothetical protein QOF21_2818 [Actinomycetota bacterium]|jgi:hypothetical protein